MVKERRGRYRVPCDLRARVANNFENQSDKVGLFHDGEVVEASTPQKGRHVYDTGLPSRCQEERVDCVLEAVGLGDAWGQVYYGVGWGRHGMV